MEMRILALNGGSSTLRFSVHEAATGERLTVPDCGTDERQGCH